MSGPITRDAFICTELNEIAPARSRGTRIGTTALKIGAWRVEMLMISTTTSRRARRVGGTVTNAGSGEHGLLEAQCEQRFLAVVGVAIIPPTTENSSSGRAERRPRQVEPGLGHLHARAPRTTFASGADVRRRRRRRCGTSGGERPGGAVRSGPVEIGVFEVLELPVVAVPVGSASGVVVIADERNFDPRVKSQRGHGMRPARGAGPELRGRRGQTRVAGRGGWSWRRPEVLALLRMG